MLPGIHAARLYRQCDRPGPNRQSTETRHRHREIERSAPWRAVAAGIGAHRAFVRYRRRRPDPLVRRPIPVSWASNRRAAWSPARTDIPAILHDFEVAGPVARNVGDIILAMNAIGGASANPIISVLAEPAFAKAPLRIHYARTFSGAPVDPMIAAAVDDVAAELVRQGHSVDRTDSFDLAAPITDIWPVISQTGLAWLLSQHKDADSAINPMLADMARNGRAYSAADI